METLIDHVYTNVPGNITEHTVPHYSISDHFPICITRPVHNSISYRDTRHLDEQQFLLDMENLPWFMIFEAEDSNFALNLFETLFQSVMNGHAPKKIRRVKRVSSVAWSTGAQLIIFFCFRFSVVLFDRPGISIRHVAHCICRVLVFASSWLFNLIYLFTVKIH